MDRLRVALRETDSRLGFGRDRSRSRNPSFKVKDVKSEYLDSPVIIQGLEQAQALTVLIELPASIVAPYRYTQLYDRQIRLVELHAPDPGCPEEIHCTIRICSLDECPLYTAVSYMWGRSLALNPVHVDGQILQVQESLSRLLLDLRRGEPRLLWIDQVAINQHDPEERMQQVKIMGEVYARANYAISWLGDELPGGDLGAQMLHLYERQLPPPQDTDEHSYKALEQIYLAKYWTRRWVTQEVMQAKTVVVHVAGVECSLTSLGELALDPTFPWPRDPYVESVRARLRETLPVRLYEHRRAGKRNLTLTNMLLDYSTTECSERHDIVFAFLSLTPRITAHINAGYNTNIINLMVEVLRIACRLESLPPQKVVSFAIFLRHQFKISRRAMAEHDAQLRDSGAQPLLGLKAEVRVRGLANPELSVKQEQLVISIRNKSNPLAQLDPLLLAGNQTDGIYHPSKRKASTFDTQLSRVSSQDLCAFGWDGADSSSLFGASNQYVGLASAPIHQGDEVWQFLDTDVALIVRYHAGGCTLVARAQLFQKPSLLDRMPSNEINQNFISRAWRGGAAGGAVTSFQLDVPLFLHLIAWADMHDD